MKKVSRLEKRERVVDISKVVSLKKLRYFLLTNYDIERVADKGSTVLCHMRINIRDGFRIDVIIYSNDTVFFSSSLKTPEKLFEEVKSRILELANESVTKLTDVRPITLLRAANILKFVTELDVTDEYQRMVIVILSDTSNEIILTEKMQALKIKGPPLISGIPDKIGYLEKKGKNVYLKTEIINTRTLRNGIVHQGEIPHRDQALEALHIAEEVLESA